MKVKLGDLTKIRTGKLDANASSPNGKYPFFTCSKEPLRINSHSYDCECVLVAGNGDLNVKYYNGKFDAYQRTYIIEDNGSNQLYMPYLYYFMEGYVEELRKLSIGGVIKYIKLGNLTEALIELPKIEDQRTIVDILNKSKRILSYHQQQLQKLDELVKARFVELFGDPILNQKQFPVYRMDEVVEFQGGSQPDKKFFEYEPTDDNIRLIQIRDYKTDKFITYIPRAMAKRFCTADDIMIGRYGPPIFQILQGIEGSFNVALMKATPKKGNKEFIRQFLKQECLLDYLEGMSKRTAGQDGIQMDKLKAYPFPLPPVELQNQFEKFANQVDKSKLQVPSGNALCIRYPIFYRNNIFERSIKC